MENVFDFDLRDEKILLFKTTEISGSEGFTVIRFYDSTADDVKDPDHDYFGNFLVGKNSKNS